MGADVLGDEIYERFVSYWKEGSLRKPEEVAPLAVFLASSDSDTITGEYGGLQHYAHLGWHAT